MIDALLMDRMKMHSSLGLGRSGQTVHFGSKTEPENKGSIITPQFQVLKKDVFQLRFSAKGKIEKLPPAFSPVPVRPAHPVSGKKIPDEVYRILFNLPKTDLHVHQSGSSDLMFLEQKLYQDILNGSVTELEYYNSATRKIETVDLSGLPIAELMEQKLTRDIVRHYYRVFVEDERHKQFSIYDETTDSAVGASDSTEGLNPYRATSQKINPHVKNIAAAQELAELFAKTCAFENVRYVEYRVSAGSFKPQAADSQTGEATRQVIEAVNNGFQKAVQDLKQNGKSLDYGLIVLIERQGQDKLKTAMDMVQQVIQLRIAGYPIVGVDLAGDELNNPVTDFEPAFQLIHNYNNDPNTPPHKRIGITIHAGETKKGSGTLTGPQSVAEALRVGFSPNTPLRIGHGIQTIFSSSDDTLYDAFKLFLRDPESLDKPGVKEKLIASSPLLQELIDKQIVLEMCPKSNIQTRAVFYHDEHPAVFLSRLGVKVAISTDNRTISNTDTPNEYVKLFKYAHANYDDIKRMIMAGFEGSFIFDPARKLALLNEVKQAFDKLESDTGHKKGLAFLRGEKPWLFEDYRNKNRPIEFYSWSRLGRKYTPRPFRQKATTKS